LLGVLRVDETLQGALARRELGWQPRYDDLGQIVTDALSWERILTTKNLIHDVSL
jgi:UDP-glucose 4-epimerase